MGPAFQNMLLSLLTQHPPKIGPRYRDSLLERSWVSSPTLQNKNKTRLFVNDLPVLLLKQSQAHLWGRQGLIK
jgi:hypothetical protein